MALSRESKTCRWCISPSSKWASGLGDPLPPLGPAPRAAPRRRREQPPRPRPHPPPPPPHLPPPPKVQRGMQAHPASLFATFPGIIGCRLPACLIAYHPGFRNAAGPAHNGRGGPAVPGQRLRGAWGRRRGGAGMRDGFHVMGRVWRGAVALGLATGLALAAGPAWALVEADTGAEWLQAPSREENAPANIPSRG